MYIDLVKVALYENEILDLSIFDKSTNCRDNLVNG